MVAATFLVAEVDGEIVGRASVRHELNDFLATNYVLHPRDDVFRFERLAIVLTNMPVRDDTGLGS